MSRQAKGKGSGHSKLRQTHMGNFLPNSTSEDSSKKRKVNRTMLGSFWTRSSQRDTEQYRNDYPGKVDHPELDKNLKFYTNKISSSPDGDYIDEIHKKWKGDYSRLERHHGYIQWIFPIREDGMNWQAQELQLHEAKAIGKDVKARQRVLESYKMMLDFYGMELKDLETGKIARALNWRDRFQHLNRSYHNYLRITRILKSLGELGYEHLKFELVQFFLYEAIQEGTLNNLLESCVKFWIGVVKDDDQRRALIDLHDVLWHDVENKEKDEREKDRKGKKEAKGNKQADRFEDDVTMSSDVDPPEIVTGKEHNMSSSDDSGTEAQIPDLINDSDNDSRDKTSDNEDWETQLNSKGKQHRSSGPAKDVTPNKSQSTIINVDNSPGRKHSNSSHGNDTEENGDTNASKTDPPSIIDGAKNDKDGEVVEAENLKDNYPDGDFKTADKKRQSESNTETENREVKYTGCDKKKEDGVDSGTGTMEDNKESEKIVSESESEIESRKMSNESKDGVSDQAMETDDNSGHQSTHM